MKLATIFGLAIAILFAGSTMSPSNADAQGILRRLQSRVQARRAYTPPAPPAANTPAANMQRPNSPAANGSTGANRQVQNAPVPANPIQTNNGQQRPSSSLDASNNWPGSSPTLSATGPKSNNRQLRTNPATAPSTPASREAGDSDPAGDNFGGSILERGFDDEDSSDTPNPPESATTDQATLGIDVFESLDGAGLQVSGFRNESRADDFGMKVGDVLLSINGNPVRTIQQASNVLSNTKVGQTMTLEVRRQTKIALIRIPMVAKVVSTNDRTVVAKPPTQASPTQVPPSRVDVAPRTQSVSSIGLTITDLGITAASPGRPGVTTQRGIQVAKVDPASPAAIAGIQVGDRLVSIEGRIVVDGNNLNRELSQLQPGQKISTRVVRGSNLIRNQLTLAPKSQWPAPSQLAASGTDAKSDGSPSGGSSVLGGLGSALGGFFGSSSKATGTPATAPQAKQPSNAVSQAGAMQPSASTSNDGDDIPFEDLAPIQKSTFIEPLPTPNVAPRDEMELEDEFALPEDTDPQALESIDPPAKLIDPVQAEIEALERKLEALRAKAKK